METTDFFDESEPAQEQVPATIPVVATPVPDIRQRIEMAVLEVEPTTHLEALQMTWTILSAFKEFVKNAEDKLKPKTVEWIKVNGEFMIADERFYVGVEKEKKCFDMRGAVLAILGSPKELIDSGTGEVVPLDTLMDCLSSNAFKPATAMKQLGDESKKFFKIVEKSTLKRDETPRSELQRVNELFLK
jgi:hypothetical protein